MLARQFGHVIHVGIAHIKVEKKLSRVRVKHLPNIERVGFRWMDFEPSHFAPIFVSKKEVPGA